MEPASGKPGLSRKLLFCLPAGILGASLGALLGTSQALGTSIGLLSKGNATEAVAFGLVWGSVFSVVFSLMVKNASLAGILALSMGQLMAAALLSFVFVSMNAAV